MEHTRRAHQLQPQCIPTQWCHCGLMIAFLKRAQLMSSVSHLHLCEKIRTNYFDSAHAVRPSSLRNLSLRSNRFSTPNGVQLALLMKDYPDAINPGSNLHTPPSTPSQLTFPQTPNNQNNQISSPTSPTTASSVNGHAPGPGPVVGHLPHIKPPPRHPSSLPSPTTTYTPYIPRSKRLPSPATPSFDQNNVSIITSSPQGGVTTRNTGPSAALLDNIRALDNLPRLGALRTLDLRGNDLRVSFLSGFSGTGLSPNV